MLDAKGPCRRIHIGPAQRERFTRSEASVRQGAKECRVSTVAVAFERLAKSIHLLVGQRADTPLSIGLRERAEFDVQILARVRLDEIAPDWRTFVASSST
jgi:hypothetical protein